MREIRPSGSAGGGTGFNRSFLPRSCEDAHGTGSARVNEKAQFRLHPPHSHAINEHASAVFVLMRSLWLRTDELYKGSQETA